MEGYRVRLKVDAQKLSEKQRSNLIKPDILGDF